MKLLASDSLLAQRDVQRLLLVAALCFGSATWGLEAILSRIVQGAPPEPLGGIYRLVESVLWVGAAAIAIRIAERWPIENVMRDWRRSLTQLGLAIALGPIWGMIAYAISPYLMPWWYERGMWGVIAKEAKGALFGYGVTTVLVHVILRARRQRAREVAATAMERAAAEAQLVVRKLELQPAAVLRSMDAIARMIPNDVDAANEALVALADGMRRSLTLTRVELVPLRDELGAVVDALRLRALTVGPRVELSVEADGAFDAMVPALILPPLVDELVEAGRERGSPSILLHAEAVGTRLTVHLICDAVVRDAAPESTKSTARRLEALYGSEAALRFGVHDESSRVEIDIPLRAPIERVG